MKITKTFLKKKLHTIWSRLVRHRDGYVCQWCSKVHKNNHAHHIVAKSMCGVIGLFDLRNGMTLCYRCHMFRLKSEVDEYIVVRDRFLKKHGLTYDQLREEFSKITKWILDDYLVIFNRLTRMIRDIDNEETNNNNNIFEEGLPQLSVGKKANRKSSKVRRDRNK